MRRVRPDVRPLDAPEPAQAGAHSGWQRSVGFGQRDHHSCDQRGPESGAGAEHNLGEWSDAGSDPDRRSRGSRTSPPPAAATTTDPRSDHNHAAAALSSTAAAPPGCDREEGIAQMQFVRRSSPKGSEQVGKMRSLHEGGGSQFRCDPATADSPRSPSCGHSNLRGARRRREIRGDRPGRSGRCCQLFHNHQCFGGRITEIPPGEEAQHRGRLQVLQMQRHWPHLCGWREKGTATARVS